MAIAAAPALSLALGAAGAGVSAYGTYEQGQATANAASYSAEVAKNNQIVAEQNAKYAEAAGEAQATATGLKGSATAARVKTAQAASGIDVNRGSAVDVQVSQREQEQLDTETVLNNAMLQAYGYRTAGVNYGAEAGLQEAKASQAKTGGVLGAAGSLLSNASGLGFKWSGSNKDDTSSVPSGGADPGGDE